MTAPAGAPGVVIPAGSPEEGAAGWTRASLRAWVDREVAPFAGEWDRAAATPPDVIRRVAEAGFLGAIVPREQGGAGADWATFALLNEELGRGCSSIRSLLTVHSMATFAVLRWGSRAQKERWLGPLARGETIGAFGLSEPGVGSDAGAIETKAVADGDGYRLHGRKKWTTYGQVADLFLVFARTEEEEKPMAFLVERDTPGLTVVPLGGITGTRASMLAELHFDGALVPKANRVAGPGFGIAVALAALEVGRLSVGAGCVGIVQACLDASLAYASARSQFGGPIREHQLVQRMITNMATDLRAARLLCRHAAELRDAGDPTAAEEIFAAKYFASTAATRAALDAVQIHGANGCSEAYPVERFLRDSRVMEIIEGSTQIQQLTIAQNEYRRFDASPLTHTRNIPESPMSPTQSPAAAPAAGSAVAAPPAADRRKAKKVKVVVWDLDNTVWDGVLLEDPNVTLKSQVPGIMRELDARGILQSVASKNDHGAAMAKLRELGLDEYFLYPQINWNSKASSIEQIRASINIGMDAVAFVDDQPFEREEVAHTHPQVLCIDTAELDALLDMPEMNPEFITDDSRIRRRMYMADIERNQAEAEFVGPTDDFLATLGMRFTIARCEEDDLQRAEELTVRTNQLNTTGYTYSYEELNALRRSPDHLLLVASLEDKYGTYGKIGLALVEKTAEAWTLKLLLMSCRVMSRGVGTIMMNYIMGLARDAGVRFRAEFKHNGRNRMMYVTYKFGGFREVGETDGLLLLEHDLEGIQPFPDYVDVKIEV